MSRLGTKRAVPHSSVNIEFADFLDRLRSLEEACAEHEARLRMLEHERSVKGDLYVDNDEEEEPFNA